jgi:hypothetical protein
MQGTILLPIYLQDALPEDHYDNFCHLMEAIGLATDNSLTEEQIAEVEEKLVTFSEYYEKAFYGQRYENLAACLPVFHQIIHVAHALRWIGPMHVYSQWAMERMCGILTRTCKSRVSANRNIELTLIMTEQKHMMGYVLSGKEFARTLEDDDSDSSDDPELENPTVNRRKTQDENISLLKVFEHRIALSLPVRTRESLSGSRFTLKGMKEMRAPDQLEQQRIGQYILNLAKKRNIHLIGNRIPDRIRPWKWCDFRDDEDNKKRDFKVTSATLRSPNNTRNSSMVSYHRGGDIDFAEVQFFFTANLPAELSCHGSSTGSDGDLLAGVTRHTLAYVKQIPTEPDGRLIRRIANQGAFKVIAIDDIEDLIGLLTASSSTPNGLNKGQYITKRYTSML